MRHHVTPREHLFYPVGTTCPVELKRLAAQRYTVAKFTDGTVDFDLTWSWQEDRSRALKGPWTGKTVFRFPGTNEVDYGIEAREVRHASTDTSTLVASGKASADIHVIGSGPFEIVFLEDNQATIRIMESGKSPSFRHTDKTQRLSLAWLSEQFKRKHFNLVYVASMLQAAGILTKPFPNAERSGVSH